MEWISNWNRVYNRIVNIRYFGITHGLRLCKEIIFIALYFIRINNICFITLFINYNLFINYIVGITFPLNLFASIRVVIQ